MKFGFLLPNDWGVGNPRDVIDLAAKAETLGFNASLENFAAKVMPCLD